MLPAGRRKNRSGTSLSEANGVVKKHQVARREFGELSRSAKRLSTGRGAWAWKQALPRQRGRPPLSHRCNEHTCRLMTKSWNLSSRASETNLRLRSAQLSWPTHYVNHRRFMPSYRCTELPPKPASSNAAIAFASSNSAASTSQVAVRPENSTLTFATPGSDFSASCTLLVHPGHVMPRTSKTTAVVSTELGTGIGVSVDCEHPTASTKVRQNMAECLILNTS